MRNVVFAVLMLVGCGAGVSSVTLEPAPAPQIQEATITGEEAAAEEIELTTDDVCILMCARMQRCSHTGASCLARLCDIRPEVCVEEATAFFACVAVLDCDAPAGICAAFANEVVYCLDNSRQQEESI